VGRVILIGLFYRKLSVIVVYFGVVVFVGLLYVNCIGHVDGILFVVDVG